MIRKYGFTLAEVLITFGIIGVISALTLPVLIANQKKREAETRLKKVYSEFNQAIKLSEVQNGEFQYWAHPSKSWNGPDNKKYFEEYYKPYLNIVKYCGTDSECFSLDTYDKHTGLVKFILSDGVAAVFTWSATAAYLEIDINGKKQPNKYGIDIFAFEIVPSRIFKPYIYTENSDIYMENFNCYTRECYLDVCEKSNSHCAGYIMYNGWEIPEDYPLRF